MLPKTLPPGLQHFINLLQEQQKEYEVETKPRLWHRDNKPHRHAEDETCEVSR